MAQRDYSTELGKMVEVFSGKENPLQKMLGWLCEELMEAEVSGSKRKDRSREARARGGAAGVSERVSYAAVRHETGEP